MKINIKYSIRIKKIIIIIIPLKNITLLKIKINKIIK